MNWKDIGLHIGVAAAGVAFLIFCQTPDWIIFIINTAVWPARELWQHRPDYIEVISHPQSLLEWLCPCAAGAALIWFT